MLRFWLKLLISLTVITVTLTAVQVVLAPYQNIALKFDGQIGDFYAKQIVADHNFTDTMTLLSTPNCVLVPTMAGSLSCVTDAGALRWQTILTDTLSSTPILITHQQNLLLSQYGGGVMLISEKTGEIIWQFKNQQEFNWKQTLVSDDQTIAVLLNTRNQVYVLEMATGQLLWRTPEDATAPIEPKTHIFTRGDQVLVTNSAAYTLTSFNIKTGTQTWQQQNYTGDTAARLIFSGDLVWHETNFYTWQGADPATGEIKAKLTPPSGGVVTNLSSALVFHNYGNQLFWFDTKTGASLGTTQLTGKIQRVWFDKQVYVKMAAAPFVENLTIIDVAQKTVLWTSEPLQIIKDFLLLNEDVVVVASLNGQVTWLNIKTGAIIAKTKVLEAPLVLLKEPDSKTGFWLITTHHGTFSTTEQLTDVWFFKNPGEPALHQADLPVVGATRVVSKEKLWLVNQSQDSVIALTRQPIQHDLRFWSRPAEIAERYDRRLATALTAGAIQLAPEKNQLRVETVVTKNFQGCLITTTITPNDSRFKENIHQSGFNPWQDVTATTTLKRGTAIISTIHGFYFLPDKWRTIMMAPQLQTAETLTLETKLIGKMGTLLETTTIEVPPNCTQNFITLSADKKSLQTPTEAAFWGMGIQDAMFDYDETGSVLDSWQFGILDQPDFMIDTPRHDFKTYIKTFRQAGFSIFRMSQDNFSFRNWQSFQTNSFRAQLHTGLVTDELLKQLKTENYRVVFGIFGFEPETEERTALTAYLDYCIARFGPWIDVWELSNEAWPDEKWVTFVSDYLKKNDPYQHPITTSWDRSNLATIDIVNLHYYRSEPPTELTAEFLNQIFSHHSTSKPVLFGEFGNSETNWDSDSAERLRLKSWLAAWQRTPLIIWNQSASQSQKKDNANLYMGPIERGVIKNLVGWLSKYDGIPLLPFSLTSTTGNFCSGLTNKESLFLIYCTNSSGVARTEVFNPATVFKAAGISNPSAKWQITWSDPKTLQPKGISNLVPGSIEHLTAPAFGVDLVSEWRLEH